MRYEHMIKTIKVNLNDNGTITHTLDFPQMQIETEDFLSFTYGRDSGFQGFLYDIRL